MRFVEVSREELQNLRPAISLLERVNHASSSAGIEYTIYGVCIKPSVLEAAEESVFYWNNEGEEDEEVKYKFAEISIAIPISSDFLYYLTGSGLKLAGLTFAYFTKEEGDRVDEFRKEARERITLDDFHHLAIADGDSWLGDFLQKHVSTAGQHGLPGHLPDEVVERDSEAILNAIPEEPEEPKHTRTSSLQYEGLEDWFA